MIIKNYFRDVEKMYEHFEEHGEETGCNTVEEYLAKANAVIQNTAAKIKIETDENDGDKIYYLSETREIVFVATDGFIRTYFIADDEYFDRQ